MQWGYFVVWTPFGLHHEKVTHNATLVDPMIPKLREFHQMYSCPEYFLMRLPRRLPLVKLWMAVLNNVTSNNHSMTLQKYSFYSTQPYGFSGRVGNYNALYIFRYLLLYVQIHILHDDCFRLRVHTLIKICILKQSVSLFKNMSLYGICLHMCTCQSHSIMYIITVKAWIFIVQ